MLSSGLIILPRSVFWSADLNGRSDNTDVIRLVFPKGRLLMWRLLKKTTLAVLALDLLAAGVFSQDHAPRGFQFFRGGNAQVLAVDYWGNTGLRTAKLHELPDLECVDITYGSELTIDDVTYLSELTKLTELVIGQDSVDTPVIIEGELLKLKNLKSLESVHLCKLSIKDSDLEFIASLPKLTHLELIVENHFFGDESDLTDDCADFLTRAKSLESIYAEGRGSFTDKFISKITMGLPNLTHLDLSCPKLTDESLRLLAARSKRLQRLTIRSDKFTDRGLDHLAGAKNLRELEIQSNSLSKSCVKVVARLKNLTSLELTIPTIDDAGVESLANLQKLESLMLRQNLPTNKLACFEIIPHWSVFS